MGLAGGYHLTEKRDQIPARVASRTAAKTAAPGAQRGVQRQRAVTAVLRRPALGTGRRQRKHALPSVGRVDGGLLADAEHRCLTPRVQAEADNVGRLRLEVGVGRGHVAGQPMGRQVGLAPDTLHDILAHTEVSG